jgi:hypothetical protein
VPPLQIEHIVKNKLHYSLSNYNKKSKNAQSMLDETGSHINKTMAKKLNNAAYIKPTNGENIDHKIPTITLDNKSPTPSTDCNKPNPVPRTDSGKI